MSPYCWCQRYDKRAEAACVPLAAPSSFPTPSCSSRLSFFKLLGANLVRTGGRRSSSMVLVDVTAGGAGRLEVDATRFLLELEDFFLSKKKKKKRVSQR